MKAIRVHETGGPEVMRWEDVENPDPGPGQVRVRLEAAGLNFIDIYHREGRYTLPKPFTPGREGAGTAVAVGAGVEAFAPGDRVAFGSTQGGYAEEVLVPWHELVRVPDGVALQTAAALMLQGMTAHYLAHDTFPLRKGHTALVTAAAGGVGHLLVQIAKRLGARVLGTASNEEKAELARQAGADEIVMYRDRDLAEEARRLTDGRGVDVVYDSVGKDTFAKSLDSLRPRGMLVLFGASSGAVPPFDPITLNTKGSLFLTRPSLHHYVADRAELTRRADDLFGWVAGGELHVRVDRSFPLAEAAEAHRYMEGGKTRGKVLLVP
jgi:NADPH2:quinone reductase